MGRRTERTYGAAAGVAVAAVALGVGELVAVATGPRSAPLVAVGAVVIDAVPTAVKELAVRVFYTYDKLALQIGTAALLALAAAAVGVLALRRLRYGVAGVGLFGLAGVLAAATRPGATWAYPIPSILGALAGATLLAVLRRSLTTPDTTIEIPGTAAAATPDLSVPAPEVPAPEVPATAAEARDSAAAATPEIEPAAAARGRRRFLRLAGGSIAAAAVAGVGGRWLAASLGAAQARAGVRLPAPASPAAPLPAQVELGMGRVTPFLTRSADLYRVDTALVVPQVVPKDWHLRIHGRVGRPLTLTFDELLRRPMVERYITLACVSNEVGGGLVGNVRWLGVPVKDLLDEVEPHDGADQVVSRAVDGWTAGTPTAVLLDGRDALVAVGMNGEPLPIEHGFPARLVVPGLYGYVSATKWLAELELSRFADFTAYWARRGWAAQAPVKTQSRIDTPGAGRRVSRGTVLVAGVAWAQHRGVSTVEVRADDGPWQQATLAAVPSIDTWRQWSWPWEASPGRHRLQVRATDNAGDVQAGQQHKPLPDGATGWHTISVNVA